MKKTPGGHTTDAKLLRKAVAQDKDFICRQSALDKAGLVVLCGSIAVEGFQLACGSDFAGPWRKTTRGIPFVEHRIGKFAINYSHPEARVQDHLFLRPGRCCASDRTAWPPSPSHAFAKPTLCSTNYFLAAVFLVAACLSAACLAAAFFATASLSAACLSAASLSAACLSAILLFAALT